jgi:hypothetical protein
LWDKHGIIGLFVDKDRLSCLEDRCEKAQIKVAFIGRLVGANGSVVPDKQEITTSSERLG